MRGFCLKFILTSMFEIRKQHLRPRAVVEYGVNIFGPGLFITLPDHLEVISRVKELLGDLESNDNTKEKEIHATLAKILWLFEI